jgi:hypothetical protein
MTNYQNGKIYKIEALNGEEGDVYIGSTCKQYLSQRMDKHRYSYKYWTEGKKLSNVTAYILFDKYGVENCNIILLETFPCTSHDELSAREAFYIKSMKCVNKNIPLRTDKEYREDNKDKIKLVSDAYYQNNKEKILIHNQKYYFDNVAKISIKSKAFYQENKELISQKSKEYYDMNKDKFAQKQNEYYYSNQDKIAEAGKKYYDEHKDKISEKGKIFYQENKDKICERNKLYVAKNIEAIKEYKAKWFQDNKNKNKEKMEEKITCECGSICRRNGMSEHKRSIKHKKYEKSI